MRGNAQITEILKRQLELYPKLQVEDAVKLLYQNEFAGGHLVKDAARSFERLRRECAGLKPYPGGAERAFEDIGNGLCRLNLRMIEGLEIKLETINRFFVETANTADGSVRGFEQKLGIFMELCRCGELPFELEKVQSYINSLRENGYPPVSHSAEYRDAYRPAYRVIKDPYREYIDVFRSVDSLLKAKAAVNVAIDGNCGAGKSALASLVSGIYDCNVFHMDDFFLRPEQRIRRRLDEPGGNADWERFYGEVITGLKSGKLFTYRKYDCKTQKLGGPVPVTPKALNIIEGSYSVHPELIGFYDLKIFLQVRASEQSARILKRNGAEMHGKFLSEWIPMENRYFEAFDIKEKCDLIFGG